MANTDKIENIPVHAPTYSADELRDLVTWDDVLALVKTRGDMLLAHEVLGDGFALLKNKDLLCEQPLVFLEWRFSAGDFGEFVSARVITKEQSGAMARYIVNDGSVGIYQQLRDLSDAQNVYGGLAVRNGLRKSEYTYVDDDGKEKPATTYYLDTSA